MALGPENTLAAFDLGMAAGADGLELDVHLSADGVPVVHHDRTLERTTDGSGPVAARTAVELARLDAGYHFALAGRSAFRGQGIGIPSLREVLHRYRDARIIVEMKVDEPALGEAVVREIRAADAVGRVCAAGYGALAVRAVRSAEPVIATGATRAEVQRALRRTWLRWPVRRVGYQGYQIPEVAGRLRIVSPRFVRYAHDANLKVQVWTVEVEPDMRRLLGWGVDALISNRPDLAVRIRDDWMRQGIHDS
jgi:glycerophosphoryl diester phosphodiesterase